MYKLYDYRKTFQRENKSMFVHVLNVQYKEETIVVRSSLELREQSLEAPHIKPKHTQKDNQDQL
jgi:hypothetical protein